MTTHSDTLKNINQWIDALESGDYQQATGRLRRGDAMCCLGVACHISNISNWTNDKYIGETEILPNKVVKWLGISGSEGQEGQEGQFYFTRAWILSLPEHIKNKLKSTLKYSYVRPFSYVVDNNARTYLSMLNDHGWTFKEIAELIRSNPPGLFNNDIALSLKY